MKHTVMKPVAASNLPPAPAIPGGFLNPPEDSVSGFDRPAHPPPSSTGAGRPDEHEASSTPALPAQPPSTTSSSAACDVTDPQLFWLNNRPFVLERSVGKGGCGEVFSAEMMLPLGMEVRRNEDGAFVLDGDGRVCVQQILPNTFPRWSFPTPVRSTTPVHGGPSCSTGGASAQGSNAFEARGGASEDEELPNKVPSQGTPASEQSSRVSGAEVQKALELYSEVAPDSMNFSMRGGASHTLPHGEVHGTDGNEDHPPHHGEHHGAPTTALLLEDHTGGHSTVDSDPFAVRAGRLVYGCGAFFALKIQQAGSAKQLEEFAKEAANLEKLRGHANIVQIRDHAIGGGFGVVILMELAACDLHSLFSSLQYSFDVVSMLSLWQSLVRGVDAAHKQEIIHQDLKPQNFLLVPIAPPFADRILATTNIPVESFEFRIVSKFIPEGGGLAQHQQVNPAVDKVADKLKPDVELILRDQQTGAILHVLKLVLKVSDFGHARPLDLEESHLSILGPGGTIKYMAPETFRPSADGLQRVCKRVDIWALGIMLFQMLHCGGTPYDRFCARNNVIRAAVAIQSDFIHAQVMKFDRRRVWVLERERVKRDLRALLLNGGDQQAHAVSDGDGVCEGGRAQHDQATTSSDPLCQSVTAMSLLSTEFLFRICERCLAFEASDRVGSEELKTWSQKLLDGRWWNQKLEKLSDAGALQALFPSVHGSRSEDAFWVFSEGASGSSEAGSHLDLDGQDCMGATRYNGFLSFPKCVCFT